MTTTFVKVLKQNMNHHGFQYQFGLNILEDELNTDPNWKGKGGLYYTDIKNLDCLVYYGDFVSVVQIPEDATVVQYKAHVRTCGCDESFRTDKMILTEEIYSFYKDEDVRYLISMCPTVEGYLNDQFFLNSGRRL
jgi:hypothetical protein